MATEEKPIEEKKTLSFVEQLVEQDLAEGKNADTFPPRTKWLLAHRTRKSHLHGLRCG